MPISRRALFTLFGAATTSALVTSQASAVSAAPSTARANRRHHPGVYAYVANWDVDSVSVIDTSTNEVTATVTVGRIPWALAALPNGRRVYVANFGDDGSFGGNAPGSVSVIDTRTNTVVATIALEPGRHPMGVVSSCDGSHVYLSTQSPTEPFGMVSVIDTETNEVTGSFQVGGRPQYLTVNARGTRMYVSNLMDSTVSVVDTRRNQVIGTVALGGQGAGGIAVSHDGCRLYVVTYSGSDVEPDRVSVVDTGTLAVVDTVAVGKGPFGITLSPDSSRLYVPAQNTNDVTIVDTTTNRVTDTVPVGEATVPMDAAVTRDGRTLYVAQAVASRVLMLDTRSKEILGTIPTALGSWVIELVNVQ